MIAMERSIGLSEISLLQSLLVGCILVSILIASTPDVLIFVGSQIMLYFVGGSLSYIIEDLGAAKTGSWLPVANTLAITAVAPFVGTIAIRNSF
jgi:hypothetical protein